MLDKVGVVGVVGVGAVGQACAFALMLRGSAREVVLVDRAAERATGVATDMRYGAPLSPAVDIRSGDWGDLAGAGVVLTDPPDPLADLTRALAGHDRVLSTGTTIDTLRFRVHVAAELGVHPSSVEGLVVGEHGTSEVMLWSSLRVAGTPLLEALDVQDALAGLRERVEKQVRFANITIIEGNGASQFGIGVACAQIAEAILRDEHVVLPVAAYRERHGVTIALPTIVGREGAAGELEPSMSEHERRAFERSAATLRETARGIGVSSVTVGPAGAPSSARGGAQTAERWG